MGTDALIDEGKTVEALSALLKVLMRMVESGNILTRTEIEHTTGGSMGQE